MHSPTLELFNVARRRHALVRRVHSGGLDLPVHQLPDDLRAAVSSVEFVPPPTFATPGAAAE
jgi:hypothetical protein